VKNQVTKYSNTLFGLSKKYNLLDKVVVQLISIKDIYKSGAAFRLLLESKQIKVNVKKEIINSVFSEYEDVIKEFLCIIIDKKLTNQLLNILNRFLSLSKKELETKEIEIISAQKITDEVLKDLSKELNCKIQLTINPNIIGGVQLRRGNTIFDNSISYQLNQLKNTLYNL
jgi:F-type H+-transporting ATPase subunit delta